MPPEGTGTPLDRLEKKLYTPQSADAFSLRGVKQRPESLPGTWNVPTPPAPKLPQKPGMSTASIFLLAALAFTLVAGAVSVWLIVGGGRSVSSDHIEISLKQAPKNVDGGNTVSIPISIQNGNPVAMTDIVLTLDFPEGTYSADDAKKPLPHLSEDLGSIPAGASLTHPVRAILFGNENEHLSIPITLEYKTEGSSAVFTKKAQYDVIVGSSPVSINVDSLSEVSSGQPFSFVVTIRSNSAETLQNVGVLATYPFGFKETSAEPAPTSGTLFTFATLAPGEEKRVKITGTLAGSDSEERVFHFDVGTPGENGKSLAVSFTGTDVPLRISKPFIATRLSLNQEEDDTIVVAPGATVQGIISWENTLTNAIQDAGVSIKLSGNAFDPNNVFSPGGFYRSSDTTIVFDSEKDSGLQVLRPGDSGNSSFNFTIKGGDAIKDLRNPSLTLSVSVAGQRLGQTGVAGEVASTITRTVKVATDFLITSRVVRTQGPFSNSGPVPPVQDQKTTYTVLLSATNSVNSIADGAATMVLPSYASFTGKVSGDVSYNESTRTVTWDVGDVPAGSVKNAAFQVSYLPSSSQKGTSPVIVQSQTLLGYDRFVGRQVKSVAPALDIRFDSDPTYQFSQGTVQQ